MIPHSFVAYRHCTECRNSYQKNLMAQKRRSNPGYGQRKNQRWTIQDRIENCRRIQWLRDNKIELTITERKTRENESIFEISKILSLFKPGFYCWVGNHSVKKVVKVLHREVKIPRVRIRLPFNGRMTDQKFKLLTGRKVPLVSLEKYYKDFEKGLGYWIDEGNRVTFQYYKTNGTSFTIPISQLEKTVDEIEAYPFCNHGWAYQKERLFDITRNYGRLCDCSSLLKKGTTFDSYTKSYGICKPCSELVGPVPFAVPVANATDVSDLGVGKVAL